MNESKEAAIDRTIVASSVASYVQFGALLLLLWLCLQIVSPFLNIVIWGIVIAVAAQPYHRALIAKLGGRTKLSTVLLTLIGIGIIVLPAWILADSAIGGMQGLAANLEDGKVNVPPPNESVAGWPVVGEKLYALWSQADTNLEAVLGQHQAQIKALGEKLLGAAAAGAGGVLQMILSMTIAGPRSCPIKWPKKFCVMR